MPLIEVGPEFVSSERLKVYTNRSSSFGQNLSQIARMGKTSDPKAVVGSHLRVIGNNGHRVCDMSICPYVPGYNTSRPTDIIGEDLADILKDEQ